MPIGLRLLLFEFLTSLIPEIPAAVGATPKIETTPLNNVIFLLLSRAYKYEEISLLQILS